MRLRIRQNHISDKLKIQTEQVVKFIDLIRKVEEKDLMNEDRYRSSKSKRCEAIQILNNSRDYDSSLINTIIDFPDRLLDIIIGRLARPMKYSEPLINSRLVTFDNSYFVVEFYFAVEGKEFHLYNILFLNIRAREIKYTKMNHDVLCNQDIIQIANDYQANISLVEFDNSTVYLYWLATLNQTTYPVNVFNNHRLNADFTNADFNEVEIKGRHDHVIPDAIKAKVIYNNEIHKEKTKQGAYYLPYDELYSDCSDIYSSLQQAILTLDSEEELIVVANER